MGLSNDDRKGASSMKIVVVGGVAGGAGACARLRRNDEKSQIIMLEKGEHISFANCGLPYYISEVIKEEKDLLLQTPKGFSKRFNVDVRVNNEVISVDTNNKTLLVYNHLTKEEYSQTYDKLVLSPGANPVMPNIKGIEKNDVFTIRNIPDTVRVKEFIEVNKPKNCVIIGAGYIGLEMAENIHLSGINVHIVEANNHIINSLDEDMSYDVQNHIRSKGVNLYLGNSVVEIRENSVVTSNGKEIDADIIIMSIGVRPTTDFIKGSKVELGDRGEIIVDKYLKTNVEDVYALGDAISVKHFVSGKTAIIPLASPANKQARIVADVIAGKDAFYTGSQGSAIAKVFDMAVGVTGESEASLKALNIPYKKSLTYSASHASYYPGASMMFIKLLYKADTGEVLGGQIVGYEGVDKRIDVIATAIRGKMTVSDLTRLELAYAPPFSSAKDPVNMAGYVAENVILKKSNLFFLSEIKNIKEEDIFIDVRTKSEFEKGSIEGAVNIPLDELRDNLEKIDNTKTVYITCQVGLRGYLAEQILRNNNYKKVFNLSGGYRHYKQWKDNDLK